MIVLRDLVIFPNMRPFNFEYTCCEYRRKDADIQIYTDYKLSLSLTDGLAGVISERVYSMQRGDMILFRPDEIHFGRFLRAGVHRFLTILIPAEILQNFCTDIACGALMAPFLDTSPDKINLLVPDKEIRAKIIEVGESLVSLADNIAVGMSPPTADALIFSKLIELLEYSRLLYASQKRQPATGSVQTVVTRALRILNETFPSTYPLKSLAEQVGCSVTYLTRTFRQNTGKSICQYLKARRLENARRLLESGVSVTDACYESGYGDCSGFIKEFRAYYGITPGKYGKSHRRL